MFEGGLTPSLLLLCFLWHTVSVVLSILGLFVKAKNNSKTFLIYCKTSLNSFMRSKLNELLLMYF